MIGIELNVPCSEIVNIALEKKLLINVTADNVIRILPPLIINKEESLLLAKLLCESIEIFLKD